MQGNPWLGRGAAQVILNEVNSSAPSRLLGDVEVAGRRAEVVIANLYAQRSDAEASESWTSNQTMSAVKQVGDVPPVASRADEAKPFSRR